MFSAFNPSKCTHTWSSGRSGEQSGVRCLAQGSHLSRGQFLPEPRFEPTTSGYKSNALSIRATTAPNRMHYLDRNSDLRRRRRELYHWATRLDNLILYNLVYSNNFFVELVTYNFVLCSKMSCRSRRLNILVSTEHPPPPPPPTHTHTHTHTHLFFYLI